MPGNVLAARALGADAVVHLTPGDYRATLLVIDGSDDNALAVKDFTVTPK
jgi:hypothetical protein